MFGTYGSLDIIYEDDVAVAACVTRRSSGG